MGQKSNSNILRLGINDNYWSSKYLGKTSEESTFYVFQDLEIRKYIDRFFHLHGLLVDKCFINRSEYALSISISYFNLLHSLSEIEKVNNKLALDFLDKDTLSKKSENLSVLDRVEDIKKNYNRKAFKKKSFLLSKPFLHKLIGCLNVFLKNKLKIRLVIQNVNKSLSVRLTNSDVVEFRKIVTQLRVYSKSSFFKETFNILTVVIKNQASSKLLSEYIALKLSSMKRHNFFLTFLKRALTLLIGSNFSSIKGVKIKIKGRFNGVPRAKPRLIQIGEIPLQMLNSKVSYHCSTSFTSNGTFGVQLWIS
jgi:ribosomal protein S3